MSFLFLCYVYKCSKSQLRKMTSSTNTFFLGYMYAKNRYINMEFGIVYAQAWAWFYNILYGFSKLEKWILTESYIKNQFFYSWVNKIVSWNIQDSHVKEFFILPLLMLFILHFARNFYSW